MHISIEMVRKLAKLDPKMRELFYSFVDEFYETQDKLLTKEDIKEIDSKLESIKDFGDLKKDIVSLKNEFLEVEKRLESKILQNEKNISHITDQLKSIKDSFVGKIEELLKLNKEIIDKISSKKEPEYKDIVDSIKDNTKGLKKVVEEFKDKIDEISKNIKFTSKDRILSNLSKALKKKLSLNVREHFKTKTFDIKGKKITFPIVGVGTKNKKTHAIVGDIITSPSKEDIEKFADSVASLQKEKELPQLVCKILVVHEIEEDLEKIAEKKGVSIIWMQDI